MSRLTTGSISQSSAGTRILGEPREIMERINDYGRNISVPALQITLTVPFEGNGMFFEYQPNTSTSMPPSARVLSTKQLILTVSGPYLCRLYWRDAVNQLLPLANLLGGVPILISCT